MNLDINNYTGPVKRVIKNSFKYYNSLKEVRLFVLKRDHGVFDYYELTPVEIKTVSIFLGILNDNNQISTNFIKRGITIKSVFNYLGCNEIDEDESDYRKIDNQYDILHFLDYLNIRGEELSIEYITYLLFSSSNIIENYFFSEVSEDKGYYESEKMRIKEMYEHSKLFTVGVFRKIKNKYSFLSK